MQMRVENLDAAFVLRRRHRRSGKQQSDRNQTE
jgi:hypothetical protein